MTAKESILAYMQDAPDRMKLIAIRDKDFLSKIKFSNSVLEAEKNRAIEEIHTELLKRIKGERK